MGILFFLRQTPWHLPGGAKYYSDFFVFWKNGNVTVEDVKGMRTPMYKVKKKLVEFTFKITITEIEPMLKCIFKSLNQLKSKLLQLGKKNRLCREFYTPNDNGDRTNNTSAHH